MQQKTSGNYLSKAVALTALASGLLAFSGCGQSKDASSSAGNSVVGQQIQFSRNGGSEQYRTLGWSPTEQEFTWTEGNSATVSLPIGDEKRALKLRVMMNGLVKPPDLSFQPVEVLANGKTIAQWQVKDLNEYTATIAANVIKPGGQLELEFRIPKANSPKALGLSEDTRNLGICVRWLEVATYK